MSEVSRVIMVSTGEEGETLLRARSAFAAMFEPYKPFETLHLGRVDSLYAAYRNVATLIDDSTALLLFCHHDARPAERGEDQESLNGLGVELPDPNRWVKLALQLAHEPDTGFMGVAGSLSLEPGFAWWNMSDLSGMMAHLEVGEMPRLNSYGPWGRVAVLDGVLLMATGAAMMKLGDPKPSPGRFHFYDYELSLEAHLAGLKNWTLPLLMLHGSGGASVTDPKWQEDMAQFIKRHSFNLPLTVPAEPLPGEV